MLSHALRLGLFLVATGLSLPVGASAAVPAKKPNVILIVVDDLRPELGCYGVKEVVSPNFDRLAGKGIICQNAYAQYPVCNPSRSSLLSGLRPDETGIVSNDVKFRSKLPNLVTLPQLFRQNGYHTIGIGKIFHQGEDASGNRALFQDRKSWDSFFDARQHRLVAGRSG